MNIKGGCTLNVSKKINRIYEYLNNKSDVNIVDAPYFKAIKSLTSFDDDQLCWIAINNKAISSVLYCSGSLTT